jgi:activating signal cointegrator 1
VKCLSVRQPWASFLVAGLVSYEIRSWRTSYRGPLLIQAGKRLPERIYELCQEPPLCHLLRAAGYSSAADLPRGRAVGTVYLVDCLPLPLVGVGKEVEELLVLEEKLFCSNRQPYAWYVQQPRKLMRTVPLCGGLGVFELK